MILIDPLDDTGVPWKKMGFVGALSLLPRPPSLFPLHDLVYPCTYRNKIHSLFLLQAKVSGLVKRMIDEQQHPARPVNWRGVLNPVITRGKGCISGEEG